MTESTMSTPADDGDREPDLVLVILRKVVEHQPDLDPGAILEIEREIRALYGGRRYFVPKRKKHPTPAERERMVRDALTDMPTPEIERRNGVSRATIYRGLKRFARSGGD
jgi:hypothetical protein